MISVLEEIAWERKSQVQQGYDAAHDDGHIDGTLFKAAVALACVNTDTCFEYSMCPADVKWSDALITKLRAGLRRRQLVTAAALFVAEIERIDRIQARLNGKESDDRPAGTDACSDTG